MHPDLEYYASPGPLTDLAGLHDALAGMPDDVAGITAVVQGLVLHPFLAGLYDVTPPPERAWDVQVRPARAVVEQIISEDPSPLVEARAPDARFNGNCRTFSTLTVALLRRAGIPSRARCGFGGYFDPPRWLDHWIVEHHDGERWVRLDAQIDALQQELVGLADPADLEPGRFLTGGEAWLACRAGELDGDRFGILDEWGQWFIQGNIARDLAALNKVEVLPWDGWGELARDVLPPGGEAWVDEVAALTASDDLAAIRHRYETDDALRIPGRVRAHVTPDGPQEVELPELT